MRMNVPVWQTWNWSAAGPVLVRAVLGTLLLTAAILKANQALGVNSEHHNGGVGTLLLAASEFVLGLWLLSGCYHSESWWAALALFLAFACYSVVLSARGAASCSCLGEVKVDPRLIFFVDLAAITLLLLNRSAYRQRCNDAQSAQLPTDSTHIRAKDILPVVTTLCFSGFLLAIVARAAISGRGESELRSDGGVESIEPDGWLGRRFPLIEHIDIGEEISHGQWTVVLYHYDCPKCQSVIDVYRHGLADELPVNREQRVALVELPPFQQSTDSPSEDGRIWLRGRMMADKDWFIATPVSIKLVDGVVSGVSQE
jgi:hypothetical protein